MPLQCNIDSRGKRVRLIYGLILVMTGIGLLLFWALPGGAVRAWTVSIAAIAAGSFMIFESRSGWCVVRAMGFKTPM